MLIATCRTEIQTKKKEAKKAEEHINTCQQGPFPVLIEDYDKEEDEGDDPTSSTSDSPPVGIWDDMPAFSEDVEADDYKPGDRVFTTWLHLEITPVGICASSSISARLAEAHSKNSEKKSFRDLVLESLHEFEDIFSKEVFNALPQTRQWDHAIKLNTDNPRLRHSKVYPMSLNEQAELDTFLDKALKTGRIRPSKSPIGAPVFFIKKKDSSL
jgi:hypothetical protein